MKNIRMKKGLFIISTLLLITRFLTAQVSEINWKLDYEIYLKMENDSDFTLDVQDVYHVIHSNKEDFKTEFIFYPINPGLRYSNELVSRSPDTIKYKTLWSALHAKLGGGWIHFANCIASSLEVKALNLDEPIMRRPKTSWKPKPVTETWKNTRKWDHYIPMDQKDAIKEYKRKKAIGTLGDLKNLPTEYIEAFLQTNDKEYRILREKNKNRELARIDLVKIILGANYLGEAQISYISNSILKSVQNYSLNKLPSVLIFDEFDAAAVMTLNLKGYNIEKLAFRNSASLTQEEIDARSQQIYKIINTINDYNQESFKQHLDEYYRR